MFPTHTGPRQESLWLHRLAFDLLASLASVVRTWSMVRPWSEGRTTSDSPGSTSPISLPIGSLDRVQSAGVAPFHTDRRDESVGT